MSLFGDAILHAKQLYQAGINLEVLRWTSAEKLSTRRSEKADEGKNKQLALRQAECRCL